MSARQDGQRGVHDAVSPGARTWLHGETLDSLTELNEQCLELLAEHARQAQAGGQPLLLELRELWVALDVAARQRAAVCPYLIVDAGFGDPRNWAWPGHSIHEAPAPAAAPFFSGARATMVLRLALTYGWHLARSRPSAARLLLGMSPVCAERISACTLRQIGTLAEQHLHWLQPRWPGRLAVWRELLVTALAGDGPALERARMRGLQLLAAEARAAQGA
ncbi:MAG TPA: hypothetical protein VJ011_01725 [Steroidobacteraceae bacterium]|nr:hypothetical protein [Steroidobacteraceae bacterium]